MSASRPADKLSDAFSTETELRRDLGPVSATTVIIGMIIGSGIFAGPSIVARYTDSSGLTMLVWVICGLMSFCGAVSYAELGGMMPRAGGVFVYLKEAYGPLWAFLFGWTSLLAVRPANMAAIAIVFSTYLGFFITPYPDWMMRSVAVFAVVMLGFINYFGIRFGALIQNLSTFLKVGGLGVLVLFALTMTPDFGQFNPVWPEPETLNLGIIGVISLGMVAAFGAYDGWDSSTYVAEEIKNPRRNVPLSIILGLAITMVVYLLVNVAYILVLSNTGVAQSERVASDTMQQLIGPVGGAFISIAVLVSTFGTVNGHLMTGPRLCYAMAKQGMFFSWVAHIHPVYKTPSNAIILLTCGAAVYIVFLGSWETIIASRTAALWLFYITNTYSIFLFRRSHPDAPRPYRTWGYPVTPAIFVLIGVTFFVSIVVSDPGHSLLGLCITGLGVPVYRYWVQRWQFEETD